MKNYVIYQSYGDQVFLNEAYFSILSLLRVYEGKELPFEIHMYTDQVDQGRKRFGDKVIFHELSFQKIQKWRGEIDFVHRVKVEMLIDFCQSRTGQFLYIDSDTYILKAFDEIFSQIEKGVKYLHLLEHKLSSKANPIIKKMNKFVKEHEFEVQGEKVNISPESDMWNAGLIGFNDQSIPLLNKVLELTDQMYSRYEKHVMEQFAFSYYFQTTGELRDGESHVYHYWNKKGFREIISKFFGKKEKELVLGFKGSPLPSPLEFIQPRKKSFFSRINPFN